MARQTPEKIYPVSDRENAEVKEMEQRIKGTTGLLALIGSPVGHSGSPAMYNFSFQYHNLDYAYMAFDIKEDQVPAALDAMRLFKNERLQCNHALQEQSSSVCERAFTGSKDHRCCKHHRK